jgi:hypothetical protein
MKKHRKIWDIVDEIRNHPDTIAIDLWTKDMVIDQIVAHYETELYGINGFDIDATIQIDKNDLSKDDWFDINSQLEDNWSSIQQPIRLDELPEIQKKLRRIVNLQKLIKD